MDWATPSISAVAIIISTLAIGATVVNIIWMKRIDRRRRERLGQEETT
jgi:hypothetical protein